MTSRDWSSEKPVEANIHQDMEEYSQEKKILLALVDSDVRHLLIPYT
jgi:hypothetical protein